MKGIFKRFDTNGDGYFNEVEFACAFTVMGVEFRKEDLSRLIQQADKNQDGRIDYSEFEAMINKECASIPEEDEELADKVELSDDEGVQLKEDSDAGGGNRIRDKEVPAMAAPKVIALRDFLQAIAA